jgi:hypothetical protein
MGSMKPVYVLLICAAVAIAIFAGSIALGVAYVDFHKAGQTQS